MSVPKLRFKEFDREWDLKSLGDCFNLFSGYAFPSNASVDNGIKWLKIADVGIQEMTPNNLSFLPNDFKVKFPQFIVLKNDYVIALTRPILNKNLKIAKVGEFYHGALLNQRVAKIVSEYNNLDFIYSLLQKSKTVEELENSIAGTDPPNLSLNDVKEIVLGIPTVEEQTKIASFLLAIDKKISQLKQKHELLSQYKQGMTQKLFSQQIRFKADDGSEFGEWEDAKLGSICQNFQSGKSITSAEISEDGIYPVYGGNGLRGYTNTFNHQGKFVLIGRQGALCGNVVLIEGKNFVSEHAIAVQTKEKYSTDWLFRWLDYMQLNRFSESSAQAGLAVNKLVKFDIQTPCLEEQTKIANFLSAIDQKIEVVTKQIEQAKQWKKGLLQQMFV